MRIGEYLRTVNVEFYEVLIEQFPAWTVVKSHAAGRLYERVAERIYRPLDQLLSGALNADW